MNDYDITSFEYIHIVKVNHILVCNTYIINGFLCFAEIAEACLFLASEKSSYITGCALEVAGKLIFLYFTL